MQQQRNGHANEGNSAPAPCREKVSFPTNEVVFLTLEFNRPETPRRAGYGDQYMYWFAGQKIVWLEPAVHQQIVNSGAQAGDEIAMMKAEVQRGNRKGIEWRVELVQEEPAEARQSAAAPGAASARPESLGHDRGSQGRESRSRRPPSENRREGIRGDPPMKRMHSILNRFRTG